MLPSIEVWWFSRMYTKELWAYKKQAFSTLLYITELFSNLYFHEQWMRDESSYYFIFSPTPDNVRFKFSCQFKGYARVSHCGMIWISLIASEIEHFVICLLAICFSASVELSHQYPLPFLKCIVFFLIHLYSLFTYSAY